MAIVALETFAHCLRQATEAGADYHLVGGLAVGFWAQRYGALAEGQIIYSKDNRGIRKAEGATGLRSRILIRSNDPAPSKPPNPTGASLRSIFRKKSGLTTSGDLPLGG